MLAFCLAMILVFVVFLVAKNSNTKTNCTRNEQLNKKAIEYLKDNDIKVSKTVYLSDYWTYTRADICKKQISVSADCKKIALMDYESQKLYKHYLPEVLSFDEFKSVKTADGAMSFHMWNGGNGQTIDIIEDRCLDNLIKYFFYYDFKARSRVKFIIIDMYSPYVSLIKKMFPNANIIIDKFHLTQLISRSLNKTRIMVMKKHKQHHKKFKRYWKLILKSREDLDTSKWKKYTCFKHLMTSANLVDFLINLDDELKETYWLYQDLLYAFKKDDYTLLKKTLNKSNINISSYMKTSIKTLLEFLPYIKNTFNNNYHNGYIEGNNNFIKVIKRIAFGFRSFKRFKARIMICKGLIKIKKIANA